MMRSAPGADKTLPRKPEMVCYYKLGGNWLANGETTISLVGRLPAPQSVTVLALMVAMNLGFSRIYLVGCDHDWILHVGASRHFYKEEEHVFTGGLR